MANSMVHWNGNQMVAVSIVTTGTNPEYDDLLEVALLPIDSRLERRADILPMTIWVKPTLPFKISKARRTRHSMSEYALYGLTQMTSLEVFEDWFTKLNIYTTKFGTTKKLIPIAYNYKETVEPFMRKWLGQYSYDDYFCDSAVDILTIIQYLNDRVGMRSLDYDYVRITETDILRKVSGFRYDTNEPLQKCLAVAKAYKRLVMKPILD